MRELYWYKCQLYRMIDGDTVELIIDYGDRLFRRQVVRLTGIDAPEKHRLTLLEAMACENRLRELMEQSGSTLVCRTTLDKSDKYGRLLVELFSHLNSEKSINTQLLEEGLAVKHDPTRKKM